MRVPEASGAGLRTATRRRSRATAGTKSTKGALVHMDNPDCRTTADPLPGYRRMRAAEASTWWRPTAIFGAVRKTGSEGLAYVRRNTHQGSGRPGRAPLSG